MTAIRIAIGPRPADTVTDVQLIDDIDDLLASAKCSCAAGDDNPY